MHEKKLIVLFLTFLVIACQNKKENVQLISMNDINFEYIQRNSECDKVAEESFGLTGNALRNFITKVKEKNKDKNFERIILIFYKIEGEVIQYYNSSLLVSEDSKVVGEIFHVNSNESISKETNNFDIKNFYKYISSIKENTRINSSRLLVVDIDSEKTICTYGDNLKFEQSNHIVDLSFLDRM